jgi:hypothetical protein
MLRVQFSRLVDITELVVGSSEKGVRLSFEVLSMTMRNSTRAVAFILRAIAVYAMLGRPQDGDKLGQARYLVAGLCRECV